MNIQDVFPVREFYQGDTIDLKLILTEFTSGTWQITYTFKKLGLEAFTVTSQTSPDGAFWFSVPAADTADWTPGLYYVVATISDGTKKFTLGQVEIQIKADLASVEDPRSLNRKCLEDVEAALAAGAGSDVQEYTIGGTSVKKNRAGLLALRAHYLKRVRAEDGKASIGNVLYRL